MEGKTVNYITPLTVDAVLFLKSIKEHNSSTYCIDTSLCDTLEMVVDAINEFLSKQLTAVVATEKTNIVSALELAPIQQIYRCLKCEVDFENVKKVTVHISNQHQVNETEEQQRKKERKEWKRQKRQRQEQKLMNLPKKVKTIFNGNVIAELLNRLVEAEKLQQIPDYELIEKDLLKLLQSLFPNESVRLYLFGSRAMGIATRNSDLDIYADIGNTFHIFENRSSKETLKRLYIVRKGLSKSKQTWHQVVCVDNARVPILKVMHAQTRIFCDIGFSNSSGYCKTKLMQYIFELQPIVRHMSVFLKTWFEHAKLNTWISTFGQTLMVMYFMQIQKCLPSIEQLQLELDTPMLIGPWVSNFVRKSLTEMELSPFVVTPASVKRYLQKFFEFYAKFSFSTHVVCPYFGRPTAIATIESELPERYRNYIASVAPLKVSLEIVNYPMVVQDPMQLNHNVTKAMSPKYTKCFVGYCIKTVELFVASKP